VIRFSWRDADLHRVVVFLFTLTMSSFASKLLQSREEHVSYIPIKRTACTLSMYNIYMKVCIYIALLKGGGGKGEASRVLFN